MQSSALGADTLAASYSALGVKPGASIQKVRVAWLRPVKELHPDAGFDDPAASEHLKTINLAHQTLKDLEYGQAVGNVEQRTSDFRHLSLPADCRWGLLSSERASTGLRPA